MRGFWNFKGRDYLDGILYKRYVKRKDLSFNIIVVVGGGGVVR